MHSVDRRDRAPQRALTSGAAPRPTRVAAARRVLRPVAVVLLEGLADGEATSRRPAPSAEQVADGVSSRRCGRRTPPAGWATAASASSSRTRPRTGPCGPSSACAASSPTGASSSRCGPAWPATPPTPSRPGDALAERAEQALDGASRSSGAIGRHRSPWTGIEPCRQPDRRGSGADDLPVTGVPDLPAGADGEDAQGRLLVGRPTKASNPARHSCWTISPIRSIPGEGVIVGRGHIEEVEDLVVVRLVARDGGEPQMPTDCWSSKQSPPRSDRRRRCRRSSPRRTGSAGSSPPLRRAATPNASARSRTRRPR